MTNLADVGPDLYAKATQEEFGDCAGSHAGCGFAGTATAAAPVVPVAVFGIPGVVGMTGAVGVGQVFIVAGALVFVGDDKCNRRACRFAFKHAAKHLHGVAFLALGDDRTLSGPAPVEFLLDKIEIKGQAGRASIDDAADSRAV